MICGLRPASHLSSVKETLDRWIPRSPFCDFTASHPPSGVSLQQSPHHQIRPLNGPTNPAANLRRFWNIRGAFETAPVSLRAVSPPADGCHLFLCLCPRHIKSTQQEGGVLHQGPVSKRALQVRPQGKVFFLGSLLPTQGYQFLLQFLLNSSLR